MFRKVLVGAWGKGREFYDEAVESCVMAGLWLWLCSCVLMEGSLVWLCCGCVVAVLWLCQGCVSLMGLGWDEPGFWWEGKGESSGQ